MDQFKAHMNAICGVGGVKCYCCNKFADSGEKPKIRRIARRKLKRETHQELRKL